MSPERERYLRRSPLPELRHGTEFLRTVDSGHATWLPPRSAEPQEQPGVKATMRRYRQVTKAIVSVGSWTPPVSQVYDGMTRTKRHALLHAVAVAGICALMFDREGRLVKVLDDRRIGIPLKDLQAVPNVIAVGGGPDKANAIGSLLKSGVVNTAILDLSTAAVGRKAINHDRL